MIDTTIRKPMYVSVDGDAGPYVLVPVSQLRELQQLLDGQHVPYSVDEDAISLGLRQR